MGFVMANDTFSFKNREEVFNAGRTISASRIGNIAQNEMPIRETDIILEFIEVDKVISELQDYKKLIITNITNR